MTHGRSCFDPIADHPSPSLNRTESSVARNWLLALIAYFWYAERLLHIRRWEFWPAIVLVSFCLLLGLIVATWKLRDHIRWKTDWKL